MLVSRKLPFLDVMSQVHEEYGVPWSFKVAPGTSYAKAMDRFVSWGPVFEGEPSCAHVEDERISVDSMLLATKLYSRFISRMAVCEVE
jgi:acetylornithine deacetylase/succinyl-diaminopimelate desuccinylase-like protein